MTPLTDKKKKETRIKTTINKAINMLSAMQENYEGDEFPDEEVALKLGIEALKRCQFLSEHPAPFTWTPLPGETKE